MSCKEEKQKEDYSLKETSPDIGGRQPTGRLTLVEQRQFLYARIVKAKDLPVPSDGSQTCGSFVEVKIGNCKATTRIHDDTSNPEWNQVFAFTIERVQNSKIEIVVRDKKSVVGCVSFDFGDVPTRFPPDSALAPQWYRLEDRNGAKVVGELMLAIWIGNQADDAFSVAWHSDAAAVSSCTATQIRSKVYQSPRLWYLRIHLICAQDLVPAEKNRRREVYVRAVLGTLALRSKVSLDQSVNPSWNDELVFVAAEPFDESLILSVHDRMGVNKEACIGRSLINLQKLKKRMQPEYVDSEWINLEKHGEENNNEVKFASRLHLRVYLDGVYHVFDEPTYYSSDLRATSPALWPEKIGVLELGILKAESLQPVKSKHGRGTIDAYCVAKYGQKWVRTTTIVDSFCPKWDEQYYWDVYDPCTVITVGVFDNNLEEGNNNGGAAKDQRIGKVRIRLSTLETGRIYTLSYPLVVLQKNGPRKMGELHLAVKFTCISLLNMLSTYAQPLLPEMHYIHPLSVYQFDILRHQALYLLSLRLSRADPPLKREVLEYMLDTGINTWSFRKGRANLQRIMICLAGVVANWRWFEKIRQWKKPTITLPAIFIFIYMVFFPTCILPMFFILLFVAGILCYPKRPRYPPHMDTRLSHAETAHPDELDEEFDTFPTSVQGDVLRARYDRLRSIAGRLMMMIGDLATQLERVHALISWRDPRATSMFLTFCLVAASVLFVIPFRALVLFIGLYSMRPPRMRIPLPSIPHNFLRRLPARADSMI